MLKRLTRKLLILCALVVCLTMAVASTPAQGSGYQLSGKVYYWLMDVVDSPSVVIHKWDGSSWVYHGTAFGDSCGDYTYDTGGPGQFMGSVSGFYTVRDNMQFCGWNTSFANVSGSNETEVSASNPSASLYIFTTG